MGCFSGEWMFTTVKCPLYHLQHGSSRRVSSKSAIYHPGIRTQGVFLGGDAGVYTPAEATKL